MIVRRNSRLAPGFLSWMSTYLLCRRLATLPITIQFPNRYDRRRSTTEIGPRGSSGYARTSSTSLRNR